MLSSTGKLKVFIVDNDEDEQFFMSEAFNASGLFDIVGSAFNGDELDEHMRAPYQVRPDFILSDLNMPGKNGLDILKDFQASQSFAKIPVMIISTSSIPSMIEKCKAVGAYTYMVKPITFTEYEQFAKDLYRIMTDHSASLQAPSREGADED